MLLWGPGLDAELAFRRERIAGMWGRPAWADRVAGVPAWVPARLRAARAARAARAVAVGREGSLRGAGAVGSGEPGSVAVR